ncbi:MAG: hypothetical protein ACK47B_20350 [Armatimonadota bacterium]
MNSRDYTEILGFTSRWSELGVVTPDRLAELGRIFERGEDPHPEHYRYYAFREYLSGSRPIDPDQCEALYSLGGEDPDPAMGRAMMHDILKLSECPDEMRERAFASGESDLVRLVSRLRLYAELRTGLTEATFDRIFSSGDGGAQRELLRIHPLSTAQLERLAATGATRAVRNLAAEALRSARR